MSHDQLIEQLMALPLAERIDLAQALWQSIDEVPDTGAVGEPGAAIELALKRDAELAKGAVAGRSHDEVMQAAARALGCE